MRPALPPAGMVLGLLLLASCARVGGGSPFTTDPLIPVTGTVTASPGRPGPQRRGTPPSERPLAGARIEIASAGVVVARAVTDAAGRFSAAVLPGSYDITARNPGYPSQTTTGIQVSEPIDVSLVVDSGLR